MRQRRGEGGPNKHMLTRFFVFPVSSFPGVIVATGCMHYCGWRGGWPSAAPACFRAARISAAGCPVAGLFLRGLIQLGEQTFDEVLAGDEDVPYFLLVGAGDFELEVVEVIAKVIAECAGFFVGECQLHGVPPD